MNTNIEKFFEKLANDESLRHEFAEAEQKIKNKDSETEFNEILKPIINKNGFDFSFEDLKNVKQQSSFKSELDSSSLNNISGGKKKGMACVIVGGGNSQCFGFGFGEGKDGKKCMCIFGGGGKF